MWTGSGGLRCHPQRQLVDVERADTHGAELGDDPGDSFESRVEQEPFEGLVVTRFDLQIEDVLLATIGVEERDDAAVAEWRDPHHVCCEVLC